MHNANGKKSILLHVCCGPCSIVPLEDLENDGFAVSAAYVNPNIHPEEEYRLRLRTFRTYAGADHAILESTLAPADWEAAVGVHGGPYALIEGDDCYEANLATRHVRCRACYRQRFEEVARMAAERGYDSIGTTLTISPYQFTDIIDEELRAAAARFGVGAVSRDYREYYPEATRRSREAGMYRQNHCGCRFSAAEARMEREARKRARRASRATGGAAGC